MSSSSEMTLRVGQVSKRAPSTKFSKVNVSYKTLVDKIRHEMFVPTNFKTAKYHYCETRFVIAKDVKKYILIEFKFLETPGLISLLKSVPTAVAQMNSFYKTSMIYDHASFNGTNILEIYVSLQKSPTVVRRHQDHGYSSASTSCTERRVDYISWRKESTQAPEMPPRHSGETEIGTFNSSSVIMPIIRTSTASQTTDLQPKEEVPSPPVTPASTTTKSPASCEIGLDYTTVDFNEKMYHSRLSDNISYSRARDVLAYFEDHKDSMYQGETYTSTMNMLANSGINVTPSKLRTIYYSLHLERGFSKEQVDADLKKRKDYILTDSVLRVHRAEIVFHQRYSSSQYRLGRCDPELCTIT